MQFMKIKLIYYNRSTGLTITSVQTLTMLQVLFQVSLVVLKYSLYLKRHVLSDCINTIILKRLIFFYLLAINSTMLKCVLIGINNCLFKN